MASIKPKNALDSRPATRPSRFPASDRSVQGLDAQAMSAVGKSLGLISKTYPAQRSAAPHCAAYSAHFVASRSFAQTTSIPVFCIPARASPMPAKNSSAFIDRGITLLLACATERCLMRVTQRQDDVVIRHLNRPSPPRPKSSVPSRVFSWRLYGLRKKGPAGTTDGTRCATLWNLD